MSTTSVSAIKVETEIIGNMSGEVVLDLSYAWANAYILQANQKC
ncbi:hypothetical protein O6R16_03755 [Candidatus Rickettsia tasmanensis]